MSTEKSSSVLRRTKRGRERAEPDRLQFGRLYFSLFFLIGSARSHRWMRPVKKKEDKYLVRIGWATSRPAPLAYALLFFYRIVDSPKRSTKIIGKLPLPGAASRRSAFIRDLCGSVIPHTNNPHMRTRRDRHIYIRLNQQRRGKKNNSRSSQLHI